MFSVPAQKNCGHITKFIFVQKEIPMAQIDLTPSNTPALGIHFHAPNGATASVYNANSDFPVVSPTAAPTSAAKAVAVSVAPALGGPRFANPS
jgi:hypothetical protein